MNLFRAGFFCLIFLLMILVLLPGQQMTSTASVLTDSSCRNTIQDTFAPPTAAPPLDVFNDVNMIHNSDLACKPEVFGYSPEDAARIFKTKKFDLCAHAKPSIGYIDGDMLTMTCNGSYVLGVSQDDEEMGYYAFENTPQQYKRPVNIGTVEYVLVSCDPDRVSHFEQVLYRHRPKPEVIERAKQSLGTPPVNIVMLVLDSVSRRSLYRSLPETMKAVKELHGVKVADFLMHNVMGEFSSDSFMPTFLGNVEWSRIHGELPEQLWEEESIWKFMHERVNFTIGFRHIHRK